MFFLTFTHTHTHTHIYISINYSLNDTKEFIFKNGLEFCIPPPLRINGEHILSEFELLYAQKLKYKLISTKILVSFKAQQVDLSYLYGGSNINKSDFYLHCDHLKVVKSLHNNNKIIISKLEKSVGLIILNKQDINKMVEILNDSTKFKTLGNVKEWDKTAI